MAYVENKHDSMNIYFNKMREKFGNRLLEYDPKTVESVLCHYGRENEVKKLINMKAPLERCEVCGVIFPILCSPSFINQLGFQIQAQIEDIIGIKQMHKFSPAWITFYPFIANKWFQDDEIYFFNETVDGVCYSYFQYSFDGNYPYMWPTAKGLLWVRYYSPIDKSRAIRPDEDVDEKSIRFEICDTVPKSFPSFDNLPDFALKEISEGVRANIEFYCNYRKRTYDPNYWKIEIKNYFDYVIEKNRKKQEITARRNAKPKPRRKVIDVEAPGGICYFPDLVFELTFGSDINDEIIEELEDLLRSFDDRLCEQGDGLAYLSVEADDDERQCRIIIDFGRCEPVTIYGVINTLEKSGLDIESIVIG